MKKIAAIILGIMLLVAIFLMIVYVKKTSVEFTVEGVDEFAVTYVGSQKISQSMQRQEFPDKSPIYTFNVPGDGDYEMMLLGTDGQTYPFTLKIHNGKVEAETPEGVTVNGTIK